MTLEVVLDALEPYACGKSYRCPAHEDRNPSLSVKEGDDGRTLVYCWAGCDLYEIVSALGLRIADLFPPPREREPEYQKPTGAFARLDRQWPELRFLTAQSRLDRRWYLDRGERETWLRARFPDVPDWVWETIRDFD